MRTFADRSISSPRHTGAALALSLALLAGACGGGDAAVGTNLGALAEQYPTASATEIKARLDQLSLSEHYILELVGKQFKQAVLRRACEVDATLRWTYLADLSPGDCATALAQWQQYLQFLPAGSDPYANIELGRNDVLIYLRCRTGEIDASSCALYRQLVGQVDAQMAATSQQIIDNIGSRCRVGIDPGCYP